MIMGSTHTGAIAQADSVVLADDSSTRVGIGSSTNIDSKLKVNGSTNFTGGTSFFNQNIVLYGNAVYWGNSSGPPPFVRYNTGGGVVGLQVFGGTGPGEALWLGTGSGSGIIRFVYSGGRNSPVIDLGLRRVH